MPLSVSECISAEEVSSSDLEILPQKLPLDRADAFLKYVFSDVARKPASLSLRDGAAVVRYLRALVAQIPHREDRRRLLWQAQLLWKVLLDTPGRPTSKRQAIRFLNLHAETYLAGLDVDWLRSVIEQSRQVEPRSTKPPLLMSRTMSISGEGNPHLLDDLSERIHGTYYALRQSEIFNARGRIAQVLNEKGYPRRRRRAKGLWLGDDVIERVKEYEQSTRRRVPSSKDWKDEVVRLRRQAANKWIFTFVTQLSEKRDEGGGKQPG